MRKTLIIIVLTAFTGLYGIYAQQLSLGDYLEECERKYGRDADLVNGEKYFYPYRQPQGDPFFFPEAREAVIRIHDKEFVKQQLRYDLFNQQLILDFKDIYGATTSLVLRNEWVESFSFEGFHFIKMKGPEGDSGFYQQLTEGSMVCVYKWRKNYLLNQNSGVLSYYFTEAVRESFLLIGGRFHAYRNNRTFLKAFDPGIQKTIKQFMKQSKVKVNRATDPQIRHLVEYCNSLSHEAS
ncbi:MAG: hypothetical protein P1P86_14480 [Bacteroidales bacterium]|nr:hypothetical protein [Bacteroidales bacterium]